MKVLSEKTMQIAVSKRDIAFDGQFYYAVITTGVFCKPSCQSKSAKPENLRFYSGIEAAMRAGFRPCKRCRPAKASSQLDTLVSAARFIEDHADEKITLATLANVTNLSASRLQRKFKAAFGISPKVYQDAIRMRHFKQALRQGSDVTGAIYSSGFGSISRVYGEKNRSMGMNPKSYRRGGEGEEIAYACRNTTLGMMIMAATDVGVCFVQFGDNRSKLVTKLNAEFPNANIVTSNNQSSPALDAWIEALEKHISEDFPKPELPIDMRGTAFQVKVWQFLLSLEEGEVISYSELAESIGKPKAFRAAASACGKNQIAILIPCHRVLRGDGGLGGYRWGLERKKTLLEKEAVKRQV